MPVLFSRSAILSIVSVLTGVTGGSATAQEETVRIIVETPSGVPIIRAKRPAISDESPISPTVTMPGLGDSNHGLIGLIEEMEGAAILKNPSTQALSDFDAGPSNTFFIQHVPEGTTQFFPLAEPGKAMVDTWTEQIIEGTQGEKASRSPVTEWTDSVHGDNPAKP